jgi:crossover junction endodeoxyribonuclease RuvC
MEPRILGVDPGSIVTGWGLVGGAPARPRWLDAGVIRLGRGTGDLAGRLERLHAALAALVERLEPTSAAVEAPYHGANPRSSLLLAHARGVVLAVLAGAGIEVVEYTPATVKKAVTGNGRAPKEQVRAMVGRLLGSPPCGDSTDLSDALAIALCHAASQRHRQLLGGGVPAAEPGHRA